MENKKRIIIVDDDQGTCLLLDTRLKSWGFATDVAYDGQSGLNKILHDLPDLVILDLKLPALPGEEVCRQMRKNATTEKIPVIMLTGKTADVDRVVGRVIGANLYLTKPFKAEDLLNGINQLIAGNAESGRGRP
jgi:two-component system, OmpR family, phosphate regulon response regulator PhoB